MTTLHAQWREEFYDTATRDAALLSPLPAPPTWMDARSFFSELEGIRADSGLTRELDDLLNL